MKFPAWAPNELIELLDYRKKSHKVPKGEFSESLDVENELIRVRQTHPEISSDEINQMRYRLWRLNPFLPDLEGDELLERMLTWEQMKGVWEALKKRAKSERYATSFWQTCDSAVCAWRGNPRQSPKERRDNLEKIRNCTFELMYLLQNSPEFFLYRPSGLLTDEQVNGVFETLDCCGPYEQDDMNMLYAKFTLSEIIPSFDQVMMDINQKAMAYAEKSPVVRKPQSKNAEVHHFARVLSGYLKREYGQPLHDAVAMTACTVFERDDIDLDFVRKLITE